MAASGVARWRGWTAVSASTWRRVGLLLGPVILQLLLFKAIKLQVVTDSTLGHVDVADTSAVSTLIARHALPPLLLVLGALLVVLRWEARRPLGLRARIALFLAAWVGLLLVMAIVLPVPPAWLSWTFVTVVRDDLVVLLACGGAFLVLVERTRGSLRAATLGVLHVATLALMLLATLEFGYFALTGSLADAFMLRYSLANARDASYALGHEAGGSNLVFLLLPVVLTLLPLWLERRAARRDEPSSVAPGCAYVLAAAALLLLVPAPGTSGAAVQLGGSTYVGLVTDLLREPVWESSDAGRAQADAPPLFDTARLRFVAGERTTPLNVVIVVLESHRVLPAPLRARVTPFLDGLMRTSLVVDEMHAIVPHTNRALVPILCGIHPRISQGHAADVPGACLPALLRPHGYASAFFTPATLDFERKGDLLRSMGYETIRGAEVCEGRGFARVNYFGFEERALLEPSLAWVDAMRAQAKPFLLTYLTLTSHHPYQLPESFPQRPGLARNESYNRYLNTLAYADGFVAELFAAFTARGLLDSTVFVVLGDHGEAFGEHGMRFHSHVVWGEGVRVPAVIHAPRLLAAGARATGPRDQTDIVPTIAALLGLAVADGTLPGVSLLQPVSDDRVLRHATWVENQSMALRRGTRKWVYHYRRRPMEAYDLARDPDEHTDLGAQMTDAERRAVELELLRWRRSVNALYRPTTDGTDG